MKLRLPAGAQDSGSAACVAEGAMNRRPVSAAQFIISAAIMTFERDIAVPFPDRRSLALSANTFRRVACASNSLVSLRSKGQCYGGPPEGAGQSPTETAAFLGSGRRVR